MPRLPASGTTIPVYNAQLEVEFRLLQPDDLGAYARFRPHVARKKIERRLEQGHLCFTSWHGEKIADAGWTATGNVAVPYLGRVLFLEPGDVYSYDAYTHPDYRGYGLYMARNSFTARANQKEGFKRSVALVAPENYTAWVILTRSGLETIGEYSFVRLPFRGIYERMISEDEGRFYWFMISSTYKSYRLLPMIFRDFAPGPNRDLSSSETSIIAELSRLKHIEFNATSGIVTLANPSLPFDSAAEPESARAHDVYAEFFHSANPNAASGDRLATLTEISLSNLTPLGARVVSATSDVSPRPATQRGRG